MNVTTIGLDIAKSVFKFTVLTPKGRMVFKKRLSRGKVGSFSPTFRLASSAWKPVLGRTTGHGNFKRWATRSV